MEKKPSASDLERDRLNFDREKWRAEESLRRDELALKRDELNRSRWINPLVIAVLAAAAAAFGNAGVTLISSYQQSKLEREKSTTTQKLNTEQAKDALKLEQTKSEAARILEVVKTNDPDKAATNLKFLIETGLIAEESTRKEIQRYLQSREPGKGIALPAAQLTGPPPAPPDTITCLFSSSLEFSRIKEALLSALRAEPFALTSVEQQGSTLKVSGHGHMSTLLPGYYERNFALATLGITDVRDENVLILILMRVYVSRQNSDDPTSFRGASDEQIRLYMQSAAPQLSRKLSASLSKDVKCELRA